MILLEASPEISNVAEQTVKAVNTNTIVPEDFIGKLVYGLQISLLGMLIVFIVLLIIMGVIYFFKIIFYINPKNNNTKPDLIENRPDDPVAEDPEWQNNSETIAVIAAAVAVYFEEQKAKTGIETRYSIRSFKRIL